MSDVVELVQRADRLRDQADLLRRQIDELRQELLRLDAAINQPPDTPAVANEDCLAVALALAEDLGPEFSSEDPHEMVERGAHWFPES